MGDVVVTTLVKCSFLESVKLLSSCDCLPAGKLGLSSVAVRSIYQQ